MSDEYAFQPIAVETVDTGIDKPIAVFSDLHLADGSKADDFKKNKTKFKAALDWAQDMTKVYTGDILEQWQASSDKIVQKHRELMLRMMEEDSIYIHGNHDYEMSEWIGLGVHWSMKIGKVLFLHGHDPDLINGKLRWIGRATTWLGGLLERIGWRNKDQLAKLKAVVTPSRMSDEEYDEIAGLYLKWVAKQAKEQDCTVAVFGHTHRPAITECDGIVVANVGAWVLKDPTFARVDSRSVCIYRVDPPTRNAAD